jgi:hypothetical protein
VVTNAIKPEWKGTHSYSYGKYSYGKYGYGGYGYGGYGYGGYGYGGYGYGGYGHAAYDTAAAYAHYANDDQEQSAVADDQDRETAKKNWKSTLRNRLLQLMHWLDN